MDEVMLSARRTCGHGQARMRVALRRRVLTREPEPRLLAAFGKRDHRTAHPSYKGMHDGSQQRSPIPARSCPEGQPGNNLFLRDPPAEAPLDLGHELR